MLAFQTASRAWLTLAGLSLFLPADVRLGIWLPLHLAVAGAASSAIFGAAQLFSTTMTNTLDPPTRVVWTEFGLVNLGVAAIAIGRVAAWGWLVAVGGAAFVCAACLLAWVIRRAWTTGINKRHPLPISLYGFAVGCVIVGGLLGATLGSGRLTNANAYLAVKHAHMALNVLGWVGVTIAGTLITLLPTTLRVKMPAWHGRGASTSLAAGVVLLAAGFALRVTVVAAAGGLAWLAGAAGVLWMVTRVLRTQRRWRAPISARHLLAGVCWFAVGSAGLAWAAVRGVAGFDAFRTDFLVVFVFGWIVQTLLGAWLYLLPMQRPAHPDERRATLVALEFGGWVELVALNVGVALMATRGAGWVSSTVGSAGVVLALAGGGLALAKAWTFPWLSAALKRAPLGHRHPAWDPLQSEEGSGPGVG